MGLILLLVLFFSIGSCKKDVLEDMTIDEPIDTTGNNDSTVVDTNEVMTCNGYTSLCNLRYNSVAYATTHNAHASLVYGFSTLSANQFLSATEQLNAGVRCLNIKTYYTDDSNCGSLGHYLYHGFPTLGCIKVIDFLTEVKTWLDDNPHELVTFTIEGSSSLSHLQNSFSAAGFDSLMYQHTSITDDWPTLKEMIISDKRVVVFTSRGSTNSSYTGFHDYWDYTFGNDYAAGSRVDFECTLDNRGNPNGNLFLFNHFITKTTPQRDSARAINSNPFFVSRAEMCNQQIGHMPNFVMVDFFGEGNVFEVVKQLNGVN